MAKISSIILEGNFHMASARHSLNQSLKFKRMRVYRNYIIEPTPNQIEDWNTLSCQILPKQFFEKYVKKIFLIFG